MAQFDFLGSRIDSQNLLTMLLERPGTTLIADLWYKRPEADCIAYVDKNALELLMKRRGVYIWAEDFSHFPPVLAKVDDTPPVLYSIQPKLGGPCLELTLPPCYEQEGFIHLAHGILSHQREYFNPESRVWERASPQLIAGYKNVQRLMKKYLVRHRFHEPIWVGPDALTLLEQGRAKICGFGLHEPSTYEEIMRRA
jgi:hypothetical protein